MNRITTVLAAAVAIALAGPALARDDAGTRHDPYGGYRNDSRSYRQSAEPQRQTYEPRRLRAEPLIGSSRDYRNSIERTESSVMTDQQKEAQVVSATESLRSRRNVIIDRPRTLAEGDTHGVRIHRNPLYTTDRAGTLDGRISRSTLHDVGSSTFQSTQVLQSEPIGQTLSPQQIEVARYNWDTRFSDGDRHRHRGHDRWGRRDRDHDRFDIRFRYSDRGVRHYGYWGSPIYRYPRTHYYRHDPWRYHCYPGPVIIYPRHHHHHHGWYGSSFGLSFNFKFD